MPSGQYTRQVSHCVQWPHEKQRCDSSASPIPRLTSSKLPARALAGRERVEVGGRGAK